MNIAMEHPVFPLEIVEHSLKRPPILLKYTYLEPDREDNRNTVLKCFGLKLQVGVKCSARITSNFYLPREAKSILITKYLRLFLIDNQVTR
jgi:hypothetical protein